MDKYRSTKLGLEVEAIKLSADNVDELSAICHGLVVEEIDPLEGTKYVGINVPTPRGKKRLSEGNYLVRYNGGFYVRRPEEFEGNFELDL